MAEKLQNISLAAAEPVLKYAVSSLSFTSYYKSKVQIVVDLVAYELLLVVIKLVLLQVASSFFRSLLRRNQVSIIVVYRQRTQQLIVQLYKGLYTIVINLVATLAAVAKLSSKNRSQVRQNVLIYILLVYKDPRVIENALKRVDEGGIIISNLEAYNDALSVKEGPQLVENLVIRRLILIFYQRILQYEVVSDILVSTLLRQRSSQLSSSLRVS